MEEIEYYCELLDENDIVELYMSLGWYGLPGYTAAEIEKVESNSFYSVYAYSGDTLAGLGRVASDGVTRAVMSGVCVKTEFRRRGIGEGIVKRLIYFCQSGGNNIPVQLFCEDSLIPWYEQMGFKMSNYGMIKEPPVSQKKRGIIRDFPDIYGLEQITEIMPDFRWYNFDSFGELRYYSLINYDKKAIPALFMTFFIEDEKSFSVDIIFENVKNFHIGCNGIKTPLSGFDIHDTGESESRYHIRTLEDDDISFICENIRIANITLNKN
jgi:GNAT superfamily N-acetyltransferase